MKFTGPKPSLEVIDFQDGGLHKALSDEIRRCRSAKDVYEAFENSNIPKIIKEYTNISTTLSVEKGAWEINAGIYPPVLDKNHPLIDDWISAIIKQQDAVKVIQRAGKPLNGSVDLAKGRVRGYYEQIECPFVITEGLVHNQSISPEGISAVILHEVGHVMGYFEYMGYLYRTCFVMASVVRSFYGTDSIKEREHILTTYENVTGVALDNKKALSETKHPEALQVIIIRSMIEKKRHETGNAVYDKRSFEQLADNYVARQGAARDLAITLDKMHRDWNDPYIVNWFFHAIQVIIDAMILVWMGIGIVVAGPIFKIVLGVMLLGVATANDPNQKIYDDVGDRIANLRRQLVEELKDKRTTPIRKKQIVQDIKDVEDIEKGIGGYRPLFVSLWLLMSRSRRQAQNEVTVQKEIEELASNQLYVSANKLIFGDLHHA